MFILAAIIVKEVDEVRGAPSSGMLNVTVGTIMNPLDGTVEALIEWNHLPEVLLESDTDKEVLYTVYIFLQDCGIYDDTHCYVPPDHVGHAVHFRVSDQVYILLYLSIVSSYLITISAYSYLLFFNIFHTYFNYTSFKNIDLDTVFGEILSIPYIPRMKHIE